MKLQRHQFCDATVQQRIPQRFAAASLKHADRRRGCPLQGLYSAAIRCGLIEAASPAPRAPTSSTRIPQRFAAASLKHVCYCRTPIRRSSIPQRFAAASLKRHRLCQVVPQDVRIPQRFAAASLKRGLRVTCMVMPCAYSAAIRCGLIEAGTLIAPSQLGQSCIPQRFAAASLKPDAMAAVAAVRP